MLFPIGSQHLWCQGSPPKHVLNPEQRSEIPLFCFFRLCRKLDEDGDASELMKTLDLSSKVRVQCVMHVYLASV